MTPLRHLPRLLLMVTMTTAYADSVFLADGDVYFAYRPVTGANGLCGFQIRGNHMSRKVPRPEWDINIDELVVGDKRITGVSAGAFDVTSNDRSVSRKPRPPIVTLSFAVDGDHQPITATIVGTPNAANAVRAMLDAEPAARLLTAFHTRKLITISLTYQDGTTDVLQVRGWNDARKFGGGQNNFFDECMRGIAPFSNQTHVVP